MDAAQQVLEAAQDRASALAAADAGRLLELLHAQFRWTTHTGDTFNRSEYISRNTEGRTVWHSQDLTNVEVVVVGDTAVLRADVRDEVVSANADLETFHMPITQVWVHSTGGWRCLAGHAGPLRS
jgi:ketosteroid isomerase-like protein